MTQTQPRNRNRAELNEVYCDHVPFITSAMESDGRYPVKISSGRIINFTLEGEYLVARVTPGDAELLQQMSIFEVDGRERAVDPVLPIQNFFDEGARLKDEKMGRGGDKKSGSILGELAALIGEARMGELMTALINEKVDSATTAIATQRVAAEEAKKAAQNTEFNFVRLSETLTDDQVIQLINDFDIGTDPNAMPSAARVTRLSKIAPTNLPLQYALREILGPSTSTDA